jgi:hypothetical protein
MLWSECKAVAQGFLHRTDINLDGLQPLALSDINLMLVVTENEAGASMTLAQGTDLWFAPLPPDYATMRALDIDGTMCDPVDYKTLKEHGRDRSWYAISGMNVYATRSGQVDVLYTKRLLPAADGATNAVLDRYPSVYLYALLKHAAVYVQDYDAQKQYQDQFEQQCSIANSVYQNAAFGPGMMAVPMGGML